MNLIDWAIGMKWEIELRIEIEIWDWKHEPKGSWNEWSSNGWWLMLEWIKMVYF